MAKGTIKKYLENKINKKAFAKQPVRFCLPFSIRCNACQSFLSKNTRYNAQKETIRGISYYGIDIYRFKLKCTYCSEIIAIKTDPENSSYVVETNCTQIIGQQTDTAKNTLNQNETIKFNIKSHFDIKHLYEKAYKIANIDFDDIIIKVKTGKSQYEINREKLLSKLNENSKQYKLFIKYSC